MYNLKVIEEENKIEDTIETQKTDIKQNISQDEEIKESVKKVTIKPKVTNKRIDFDIKTMRRLETMLALYKMDLGDNASNSEVLSYVIKKAVDSLFDHDFKKKLEEL